MRPSCSGRRTAGQTSSGGSDNSLGAASHEHAEERTSHADGLKDKTLCTQIGQITVDLTQMREVNGQGGGFYPQSDGDYRVALRDRRFFVSG